MLKWFRYKILLLHILVLTIFGSIILHTDQHLEDYSRNYMTRRGLTSASYSQDQLHISSFDSCNTGNPSLYYDIRDRHYTTSQTYQKPIFISPVNFQVMNHVTWQGFYLNTYSESINPAIQNEFLQPNSSVMITQSPVSQINHSFLLPKPEESIPQMSEPTYKELENVFNSVNNYKDDSCSILPQIEKFLCNTYLLNNFFLRSSEEKYLEFIKKVYAIEKRQIESVSCFSARNWLIFKNEIQKINTFIKTDRLLISNTFLFFLKRFVTNKLESIDSQKRYCISMFLTLKAIESISLLARIRVDFLLNYENNMPIHKLYQKRNAILRNISDSMTEIIYSAFEFGLNVNSDFFQVLKIMKIGINGRNLNSFIKRFNSTINFSIDFVTDLIFLFDSSEIAKIGRCLNLSINPGGQTVKMKALKTDDFLVLEKIFSTEDFLIKTIKYYFIILEDTELDFLDTHVERTFLVEKFSLLKMRYRKLVLEPKQNENVYKDLIKLRSDTYYFFHFVINYCYNYNYNSANYLFELKKPYSKSPGN